MDDISVLGKKILSLLIFEETYTNILQDLRLEKRQHIADELKLLIVKEFIKPSRNITTETKSGILFDGDALNDYSFILTTKGVVFLEKNAL